MPRLIEKFLADEAGATAIEYGLIASLVGIALIAATRSFGTKLSGTFAKVTGNL